MKKRIVVLLFLMLLGGCGSDSINASQDNVTLTIVGHDQGLRGSSTYEYYVQTDKGWYIVTQRMYYEMEIKQTYCVEIKGTRYEYDLDRIHHEYTAGPCLEGGNK